MGSEMSCPCTRNINFGEETNPENDEDYLIKRDIVNEVMKGKLSKDKLLFEYSCNNKNLYTKICLISTNNVESFFQNRNLLIIQKKNEINLYYNTIFISNFVNQEELACIILQYNKGNEDRTNLYIRPSIGKDLGKKHKQNDYSAVYKVEALNFISKEAEKIKEQLLNDLYSQLKKQYRFYGIISDPIEESTETSFISEQRRISSTTAYGSSSNSVSKNYKILYKKSKLTDNIDVRYTVVILDKKLNEQNILKILKENKDKHLKGVIGEPYFDSSRENKSKYCYFFIFEGNKITPEYDESEFLCVKMDKDRNSADTFLKDIAEKTVMQDGVELLSVINNKNGFFLIFKLDLNELDDEEEV